MADTAAAARTTNSTTDPTRPHWGPSVRPFLRGEERENEMETKYFVTLAPGFYRDSAVVYSSHRTLDAARRAAKPSKSCRYVVRAGSLKKGKLMFRSEEGIYPTV
jgi:hypothetical protein